VVKVKKEIVYGKQSNCLKKPEKEKGSSLCWTLQHWKERVNIFNCQVYSTALNPRGDPPRQEHKILKTEVPRSEGGDSVKTYV